MNYRQALGLLQSRGNEVHGLHLGLHRIRAVMQAFGNPHLLVPSVHIAGTNGKGSTAAMVDSILRSAGLKVGLFTSPHLRRPLERIRVGSREISPAAFADLVGRVHDREVKMLGQGRLDIPLTYFELVTACMFLHFAAVRVDVAVVEVGLGGSLDATNIVQPAVCVITGISLDHQELLGRTLPAIAREKAGIIKPGVPVISGVRQPQAARVIREHARAAGCRLLEIDRACRMVVTGIRGGRCRLDLETPRRRYRRLRLSLAGEHQVRNAALAVTAVEVLDGFEIPARAIRKGLRQTRWPGRLEEFRCARRTLVDGAHNAEGARALRDFLRRCGPQEIHLVFGALRDKDLRGMGRQLFPLASSIHLSPVANSRSADPQSVASLHRRFAARMRLHGSSAESLRAAWQECSPGGVVVVTGSLYLVGELLPLIRRCSRP